MRHRLRSHPFDHVVDNFSGLGARSNVPYANRDERGRQRINQRHIVEASLSKKGNAVRTIRQSFACFAEVIALGALPTVVPDPTALADLEQPTAFPVDGIGRLPHDPCERRFH